MKMLRLALPCALMLGLSACSTTPAPRAPDDYPRLDVKADEPNTLVFVKPGIELSRYTKVFVAPVGVQIGEEGARHDVGDAEARAVAAFAERVLKEKLSRTRQLVTAPAPDVLSVRFRIVGLEPTSGAQMVMMVPPFALINMVSPKGLFIGSVTVGGELYEGLASTPSVAFVATRSRPGIDAASAFGRWSAAEKVLENAAERLATDLDRP